MMIFFCLSTLPLSFNGERPNDFPNYYFAGLRLFEDRPIYDPLENEVFRRLGFVHYPTNIADPPTTIVLMSPLSQLRYHAAFFTLYAFSLFGIPLLVYYTARYLGIGHWESICACSLTLFSNQYRFLLLCNHMESILLFCLTFGWIALRKGRERTGGVLWGLASALKLFPGLLIVMLTLSRRKRAVLTGTFTALILLALSGTIIGWTNSVTYIRHVIPQSQQWYGHDCNFSLMSIGYRLGGMTAGWVLTIAAFTAIMFLSVKMKGSQDRIFTVGTAGMLIISPLSWLGYGVLLFPVFLLLFAELNRGALRQDTWIFIAALVLTQYWPFKADPMTGSVAEFLFFAVPPFCGYMLVLILALRMPDTNISPTARKTLLERTVS